MTKEREDKLNKVLLHRQPNLTVVMENVDDPRNIAAVMRTCDAVGIQDIYILNTKSLENKKWSYKSGSSAAKWLTIHYYHNTQDCITALRINFNKIFTTKLTTEAIALYEIDFTESVALVFGNEHDGVSEEITFLADGNFIIPQMGIIQSLNISVACAVSVYEAFRQKKLAGHYNNLSLPKDMAAALMEQWGLNVD